MTHKFKDEIIDWLNGGEYEGKQQGWIQFCKIVQLQDFDVVDEVRKVDEYKHLREALERGETIQLLEYDGLGWKDIASPAFNQPSGNYRIKPKTKKMVQWLFKDGNHYYSANAYFDIGIIPETLSTKPIKPLPHTEIEVDCE